MCSKLLALYSVIFDIISLAKNLEHELNRRSSLKEGEKLDLVYDKSLALLTELQTLVDTYKIEGK